MPSAKDAAAAIGTISLLKGGTPRVRRAGQRKWEKAPVGTKVYGGDSIDMGDSEGSLRTHGGHQALRKGSLHEVERPAVKGKKKNLKVESGEVSFGRK